MHLFEDSDDPGAGYRRFGVPPRVPQSDISSADRLLTLTRALATLIALPLLTAESIVIGIAASYIVGVFLLKIDSTYAWANMIKYSHAQDVVTGLTKAFIFGVTNPVMVQGAVFAGIPILSGWDRDPRGVVKSGDWVRVDPGRKTVEVIR